MRIRKLADKPPIKKRYYKIDMNKKNLREADLTDWHFLFVFFVEFSNLTILPTAFECSATSPSSLVSSSSKYSLAICRKISSTH
uniref:Uncharacterized protein n=1 Tax=Romanomermis culicivorax TaxID=13658 RepID=A0A915HYA7_ROMCU